MHLSNRNLISLLDCSQDEIRAILSLAQEFKRDRFARSASPFAGKTAVLLFEKPSLRTLVSFETAIHELGGHPINLSADMVRMGKRESVADVARNLGRWVHLLIARTFRHETVMQLSQHSGLPVINALTDMFHPCQALAFGQTLQERFGAGARTSVAFVGDGNNVCNCVMVLCATLGHDFALGCPRGYEPPREVSDRCRELAQANGSRLEIVNNAHEAVQRAAVIYTDVWTSMGQEHESDKRRNAFAGFQINRDLLNHAPRGVLVSHCMPAHRGEEITSDVLDSDYSMAFDEAENRLHVQKAAIQLLFS